MIKLLKNIFSVGNENSYRVLTILGVKIRCKNISKTKMDRSVLNFVKKYSVPREVLDVLINTYNALKIKYKKVHLVEYDCNGSVLLEFDNIKVYLDLNAALNFYEIFINDAINEKPYVDPNIKYNVIDMGANRGYTVLHWANQCWCDKVFAYECVPETFNILAQNVNLNPRIKDKVRLYSYGVSDKNSDFNIYTIKNFDISATSNLELLKKTWPGQVDNIVSVKCAVKKASEIIPNLINNDPGKSYILKIDVEGSEYDIFRDLVDNSPDVFDKVETMFIETHLGYKKIDAYIERLNKGYILDNLYVNGDNIHMLVYTKLTPEYWIRKFRWAQQKVGNS